MKISAVICDANILIDYIQTDMQIIRLTSEHCFDIYVPEEIIREVDGLTPSVIKANGLIPLKASIEQLMEAIEMADVSGLSEKDCICYIHAREKKCHCATNDKALFNKCRRDKIHVIRGLGFMLELCKKNIISPEEAISTAKRISVINAMITEEILLDFESLLNE